MLTFSEARTQNSNSLTTRSWLHRKIVVFLSPSFCYLLLVYFLYLGGRLWCSLVIGFHQPENFSSIRVIRVLFINLPCSWHLALLDACESLGADWCYWLWCWHVLYVLDVDLQLDIMILLQMGFCKTNWNDCVRESCCSEAFKFTQPKVLFFAWVNLFFFGVHQGYFLNLFLYDVSRLENHGLDPNVEIVPKWVKTSFFFFFFFSLFLSLSLPFSLK